MLSFALVAALLMPTGEIQTVQLGGGLTSQSCAVAEARAIVQLEMTLSVATLISVECIKEISV